MIPKISNPAQHLSHLSHSSNTRMLGTMLFLKWDAPHCLIGEKINVQDRRAKGDQKDRQASTMSDEINHTIQVVKYIFLSTDIDIATKN